MKAESAGDWFRRSAHAALVVCAFAVVITTVWLWLDVLLVTQSLRALADVLLWSTAACVLTGAAYDLRAR